MRPRGFSAAGAVRASLLAVAALLGSWGFLPGNSRAEGISGYLEYNYSRNDTDSVNDGGVTNNTKTESFRQLYNLTLDKRIYPNLGILASGLFQMQDASSDIDGVESDSTTTTMRPYVNLYLRNPLYSAEAAFSRNDEKVSGAGAPSVTTVRDAFTSTLFWKPDRFPDIRLRYSRDHLYDRGRRIADTVTDAYQVTSNYRPVQTITLYYQGTLRESDIRLSDTETRETTHNGRVNYSDAWLRRRITLAADYNVTAQSVETASTGAGEVGIRVFPFSGLSATSDTPEIVTLLSNPALIDGSVEVGTGVNLGLPPAGGDSRPRNIGLDFIVATEINTMLVSVDRDVAQVANAFSWRIYTSDDNLNWVLRQTVAPALYSPTFNRFEIRFLNLAARFVKVVVAPLSAAVPFATSFRDILVTELQAEVRRPAAEAAGTLTSTFQTGTVDLRALLVEPIGLTYEFTTFFTKRDPGELVYNVSNGLSFFRQLSRAISGRGRFSVETGDEQVGSRTAMIYSASVTAVPFQSLYHSLTLSGRNETVAGERDTNLSLILYNIAKLYEGIDLNFGSGINFQEDAVGRRNRGTQWNTGVTLVPNRKATMTLLYNDSTTVSSGGNLPGETTAYTRAGEVSLSVTPVQTMYLFGSYRIERSTSFEDRNILNYSLNWSPFPDGTVHLTFFYNETVRTDETEERSIIPGVRWYFTPRSYLNLSYENQRTATPAVTTTSNIYSGTVRISF